MALHVKPRPVVAVWVAHLPLQSVFLLERKAVGVQLRGIREVAEANTVEGPIGEGAKFKIQPIGGTPR